MALTNLKTSFKTLKFGKDQLGGGSSKSPYIVTPIPEYANRAQKLKISATGLSYDFPVRGGALALINGIEDTLRISRFLTDLPKGPLFITKQVGLQLSNPKIETGKVAGLTNTRIYNLGLNTLAQIPANAFGTHFDRAGLLFSINDRNKYETIVSEKNKNTPDQNRLVQLYNDKIHIVNENGITNKIANKIKVIEDKVKKFTNGKFGKFVNKITSGGVNRFANSKITDIKRTLNPKYFLIDDYVGGPGSIYGIGRTTINRYVFSDNPRTENIVPETEINYYNLLGASILYPYDFDKGLNLSDPFVKPEFLGQTETVNRDEEIKESINNLISSPSTSHLNSMTFTYDLLRKQTIASSQDGYIGLIGPDFRKTINQKLGKGLSILPSTDYSKYNMEKRLGIGNPGKINRDRSKINSIDEATQDQLSMIPLFTEEIESEQGGTVTIGGVKYLTRDLIKFRFEAVNNDNPSKTTKIIFRAFITSFGDSLSSDWQSHRYTGRGENFYTYQGFNRQTNVSFKIAAQSRAEMKPLYQKLNFLMTNLMPDYQQNGFMRGSIILFTLGSWFYRQPSIINTMNITVDGDTPWEIAMNQPENGEDNDMAELPHVINVDMTITPIHNFIPRKGATIPLINTGNGENNNWLKPEEFVNLL